MDHNKLTARQACSAGVYDGWHEANFVLRLQPAVRHPHS
jgi:hypothetical protein